MRTPDRMPSRCEFVEGVAARLAPHPISADTAARDVFALLSQVIDAGETADVINHSPASPTYRSRRQLFLSRHAHCDVQC